MITRVNRKTVPILVIGVFALLGCLLVVGIVRESTPRTHDEFSYQLMAETFAKGRVSNPAPPAPEFFDTFHVIQQPVYASKYEFAGRAQVSTNLRDIAL